MALAHRNVMDLTKGGVEKKKKKKTDLFAKSQFLSLGSTPLTVFRTYAFETLIK